MKKLTFLAIVAIFLISSCKNGGDGQLVGVKDRPDVYDHTPYGMVYVPQGHYIMGTGDQDVAYAYTNQSKSVTVRNFWMDQTEITNNEYRQFVYWVRDSIAHVLLGEAEITEEEKYGHYKKYTSGENEGERVEPPVINWKEKIPWQSENEEVQEALSPLFNKINTRYYHYNSKTLNVEMMNFEYWWIDRSNQRDRNDPERFGAAVKEQGGGDLDGLYANRPSSRNQGAQRFIHKEVVNIYPDTLCWIHDFTYSYNDPMVNYFIHTNYDNYPVVGVSWVQARAFCYWRTQLRNVWLKEKGYEFEYDFRLPAEAEWEWAARGGINTMQKYPWGGPYTQNQYGCFLSNFKPQRGNYAADGFVEPGIVAHYHPNDLGLFDMAGNVAEWCDDAYDRSSVNFTHDLNPHYHYYARKDDTPEKKRKVVRGGSWKDISHYTTVYTKTYEYQDTCKSYIGFRCVQHCAARDRNDNLGKSSHVY